MSLSRFFSLSGIAVLALAAPTAFAADFAPSDSAYISLDASVAHEVTPDSINLAVSCDAPSALPRAELRQMFQDKFAAIKEIVGQNGKIRKTGSPSMYSSYSDSITSEPTFSGTATFYIRDIKKDAAVSMNDSIQEAGCSTTWDVRLYYTAKYAKEQKDELIEQINDKKEVYEDMMGVTLTKVSSLTIATSGDYAGGGYGGGYGSISSSSYDPDSNTLPVVTTLNVTFDLTKKTDAK